MWLSAIALVVVGLLAESALDWVVAARLLKRHDPDQLRRIEDRLTAIETLLIEHGYHEWATDGDASEDAPPVRIPARIRHVPD